MKSILIIALGCVLACSAYGQFATQGNSIGNITASGATCATTNACILIHIDSFNPATANKIIVPTVTIKISGTWVGTMQFESSNDNRTTWTAVRAVNTNGLWRFTLHNLTDFRVRASVFTSGSAAIDIEAVPDVGSLDGFYPQSAPGSPSGVYNCTPTDPNLAKVLYWDSLNKTLYTCTGVNTWTAGGGGGGAVSSVNTRTGAVVIGSGDIPDNAANTSGNAATATNATQLGGATFAAPGAIGGTTPAAATFTTLTSSFNPATISTVTQATIQTAVTANNGCVILPAGSFNITGSITTNADYECIMGQGQGITTLIQQSNSTNTFVLNNNHVKIAHMTITKAAGVTNGIGILCSDTVSVGCNQSLIDDVYVLGVQATPLTAGIECLSQNATNANVNQIINSHVRFAVDGILLDETGGFSACNSSKIINDFMEQNTNGVHINGAGETTVTALGVAGNVNAVLLDSTTGAGAPEVNWIQVTDDEGNTNLVVLNNGAILNTINCTYSCAASGTSVAGNSIYDYLNFWKMATGNLPFIFNSAALSNSDPSAEAGYRLKIVDNGGTGNDYGFGYDGTNVWFNHGGCGSDAKLAGKAGNATTVWSLSCAGAVTGTSLTSTVATGTAPLVVASTTNVANLNASSVHGVTFSAAQGNGASVQLSTGSTTTNDCVKFDANGNTVDSGGACGGGSSGLSGMTATQIPVAATATTVTSSVATTGTGNIVRATSAALTTPTGIVKGDVGLGNVVNSDATNASNLASGTVAAARLPASLISQPYSLLTGNPSTGSTVGHTTAEGFVATAGGSFGHVILSVSTADNTSNTYNIGVYDAGGTLLCSTGAVAGTTLFPATGARTLTFTGNCAITYGAIYYFAQSSITADTARYNSVATTAIPFLRAEVSTSSMPSTITAPTVAYTTSAAPVWFALIP